MPVVTTIHDLMPLQHPEWFPRSETWLFRAALDRVVDRSARIVAVSGTVAKALTEEAGVDPSRIVVVHEGISDTFFRRPTDDVVARTCERYGVDPGGYLIFVGAVSARKNIVTLLEAIARRGPGARLLVAGSMAFGSEAVKAAIERLGLAGTVATPGSVPDADLAALLAGAVALVHPSEYEGFGLTPLEAMAIGTPAIASRAGALPEVVGEAGILVEPRSVDEWTEAIARIERDADLVAQLSERGRAHAAGFTWRRAAEQTAAVHEAVAATKA
jgi:alpha-1,3-rhamnosyl/mannosyltransferase